jgi:hypothetical protein
MNFNFNLNTAALNNLPPDKRLPKNTALIQALLSPLQFASDAFFLTYYQNDLKERILYNGQKLVLEYALNKKFGGVFRQLPGVSDIYITNGATQRSFLIGSSSSESSFIGLTSSGYVGLNASTLSGSNFIIKVPTGLATKINITKFTNIYIPESLLFTIAFY